MTWIKKGLIWGPDGNSSWAKNSALTPTPVIVNEDEIRIYAGFRDAAGVSRIGYIDVDADNPSNVIKVSDTPVLDIGRPGCFDDNGVILGDIVIRDKALYMYYVGFQLVERVKFLAFTGLAVSHDNGDTFERYQESPIMDRGPKSLYFRAIHSIMYDQGKWRCWAGVGSEWQIINGNPYPHYNVRYYESDNGIME